MTRTPDADVVWFAPLWPSLISVVVAAVLLLSGCVAIRPPKMKMARGPAPGEAAVEDFLSQWPRPSSRLFTGTLVMAHQHVEVLGLWRFRTPWSFRLSVAGIHGHPLFEVRANWAGVHLLRLRPGFSKKLALAIGHDFSLAARLPSERKTIRVGRHQTRIVMRDAWGHIIIWQFAGSAGRLRQMLVRRSVGDILTVRYGGYGLRDWPDAMAFYRPALAYALAIRFSLMGH